MDHGSIVIDEVVAVWLVLLLCPTGLFWQLAGVLVFRFFDIVKLPPAAGLDNGPQSGWTVMIDDVLQLCIRFWLSTGSHGCLCISLMQN